MKNSKVCALCDKKDCICYKECKHKSTRLVKLCNNCDRMWEEGEGFALEYRFGPVCIHGCTEILCKCGFPQKGARCLCFDRSYQQIPTSEQEYDDCNHQQIYAKILHWMYLNDKGFNSAAQWRHAFDEMLQTYLGIEIFKTREEWAIEEEEEWDTEDDDCCENGSCKCKNCD